MKEATYQSGRPVPDSTQLMQVRNQPKMMEDSNKPGQARWGRNLSRSEVSTSTRRFRGFYCAERRTFSIPEEFSPSRSTSAETQSRDEDQCRVSERALTSLYKPEMLPRLPSGRPPEGSFLGESNFPLLIEKADRLPSRLRT